MSEPAYNIEKLSLHFRTLGLPLLLVLIAAAAAFVFWYYRDTVPPVHGWVKRTVVCLRVLVLAALLIGLSEPVLHIITSITSPEITAVLLDTSASMDIPGDPSRKQNALETLERIRSNLKARCVVSTFDNELRPLENGEPVFRGAATDILDAVRAEGARKNVSSILLISDGRWNLGEDPAGSGLPVNVPVHTVLAGSGEQAAEVVLKSVSASPVGHEGSTLPVEIVLTSSVESTETVPVEVLENNRTAAAGAVSFGGGTQARITFDIPLEKPGYHRFTASIKPVNDKQTANNTRFFGVNVIKSSFRVLMAAAVPSADLAFIRRAILSDPAFDLALTVDKGIIANPENAEQFDDVDAFIIVDGGGSILTPEKAGTLVKRVSEGCGLWLLGSSLTGDGVSILQSAAPVTFVQNGRPEVSEFFILPTETGKAHFLTSGIETPNNAENWEILPPLTSILPITNVSQSGRVLALASGKSSPVNSLPVIVTGKHGAGKVLVMPVSGIWRWQLLMEGAGKGGTFLTSFVLGTLRWLTSDTETSPLTITTDSRSYLSGQEIAFEGRLFDKVYMPVSGAEIRLVVDNDPGKKIFLEETKPAVYSGRIRGMEPGEHGFTAVAYVGNTRFAESPGAFLVEQFSIEMLDSSPDPELLGTIAARTGGISVTSAGLDSIFAAIQPSIITERHESDYHLYLSPIMPWLVIVFLTIEWIIRKRRGMI